MSRLPPHRPWPVPSAPWAMRQVWNELLFAHWPVEPAQLLPTLPPGLRLDGYNGQAWVGVVPFRLSGLRPRWLPPLPGLSTFPELNVRTYVRGPDGEKPGVWFYSLDAASPLAVWSARETGCTIPASERIRAHPRPGSRDATVRPGRSSRRRSDRWSRS